MDAPGLYAFFRNFAEPPPKERKDKPEPHGVLEYFERLADRFAADPGAYDTVLHDRASIGKIMPVSEYIQSDVLPALDLMHSDASGANYRQRAAAFDWAD